MANGKAIVKHFDLVNYILKKHRTTMITDIAELFMVDVMTVHEVYDELGIDPLEIVVKNYKLNVLTNEFEEVPNRELKKDAAPPVQFMHIKPSKRTPDREVVEKKIERPPAQYTNIPSPLGIASEMRKDELNDKEDKDADNKKDI